MRELNVELVLRDLHGLVDAAHRLFEIVQIALLRQHHLFPVPLVHVDGMYVVQVFIRPEGVHIRVDAAAGGGAQFGQFEPLPLGQ